MEIVILVILVTLVLTVNLAKNSESSVIYAFDDIVILRQEKLTYQPKSLIIILPAPTRTLVLGEAII